MDTKTNDTILYKPYTLEHIFIDAFFKQLDLSTELTAHLNKYYKISDNSQFGLLGIWLGQTYDDDFLRVKSGLQAFRINGLDMKRVVICLPTHKLVIAVLFPMSNENQYNYFQNKVQNELSLFAPETSIFIAKRCTGIQEFSQSLDTMLSLLDWNLVLGGRVLINENKLCDLNIQPLKYPVELDGSVEKAILQKDLAQFEICFRKLYNYCRLEIHSPHVLKSLCVRYGIFIAHIASINNEPRGLEELELLLSSIVNAVYWRDIWNALLEFSIPLLRTNERDRAKSLLVINTQKLIGEHYGSGITLDEIANTLHVTEEYLSSLFKKETGVTFSETIKRYRITKAKELLTTSNLKISEIANLVGYSDGKYMSRVFKEEVGMSPLQYRETRSN